MGLSPSKIKAVREVAASLAIPDPDWLIDIIRFETAGTFDPKIKNPNSSGRGLLQFIDATARELGYVNSADLVNRNSTFIKQLKGPVYDYLQRYSPFPTEYKLYISVFYPAYRNRPQNTLLPAYVQKANPGIKTTGDYYKKIKAMANRVKKKPIMISAAVIIGGIAAIMIWFYLRKNRKLNI